MSRERPHALGARLIAGFAIVILVVSPVAIWTHIPTTGVQHVVASVTDLAVVFMVGTRANLALLRT